MIVLKITKSPLQQYETFRSSVLSLIDDITNDPQLKKYNFLVAPENPEKESRGAIIHQSMKSAWCADILLHDNTDENNKRWSRFISTFINDIDKLEYIQEKEKDHAITLLKNMMTIFSVYNLVKI